MKLYLVKNQALALGSCSIDESGNWNKSTTVSIDLVPHEQTEFARNYCTQLITALRTKTASAILPPSTSASATSSSSSMAISAPGLISLPLHQHYMHQRSRNSFGRKGSMQKNGGTQLIDWTLLNITFTLTVTGEMGIKLHGPVLESLRTVCGDEVRVRLVVQNLRLEDDYSQQRLDGHRPRHLSLTTENMIIVPTSSSSSNGGWSYCEDTRVNFPSSLHDYWRDYNAFVGDFTVKVSGGNLNHSRDETVTDKLKVNRKLLHEQIATDMVVVAGNGAELKCHKAFLSAQSPVFEAMFQNEMLESKKNRVEISDMSEVGIRAFLAYIYLWETKEATQNSRIALELLKAGHKYDILDMEQCMRNLLLTKGSEWYKDEDDNVEVALDLFLFVRNLEGEEALKMKSIEALKSNYRALESSKRYAHLFEDDPVAARELCRYAFAV